MSLPKLAIVRLHGRNAETWNVKSTTAAWDRFNYDCPGNELVELAEQFHHLAEQVELIQVVFNTSHGDRGQRSAKRLRGLLRRDGSGIPEVAVHSDTNCPSTNRGLSGHHRWR